MTEKHQYITCTDCGHTIDISTLDITSLYPSFLCRPKTVVEKIEPNISKVTLTNTGKVTYRVQINHEKKRFLQTFDNLPLARLVKSTIRGRISDSNSMWFKKLERIEIEVLRYTLTYNTEEELTNEQLKK